MRARAELALNNLDAARQAVWAARQIDGKNPDALDLTIEVAIRRQDTATLQSAQEALEHLLREQPDSEAWQVLSARAFVALQQPDAALAALEAFTATDAGRVSVLAWLFLHDLHRTEGDAAAAAQMLEAASALAPEHPGVLHARLVLLAEAKRYDEIVALAMALQDAERQHPEILVSAATMLGASPPIWTLPSVSVSGPWSWHRATCGRACRWASSPTGKARSTAPWGPIAPALQINPSQPEALNNLAWILAEKRAAYGDALAYAREAVALRPNDANYRDTLAFICGRCQTSWKRHGASSAAALSWPARARCCAPARCFTLRRSVTRSVTSRRYPAI